MNTAPSTLFSGIRTAVFDLDDTLYAFEKPGGPNDAALHALAEYAAPKIGATPDAFIEEVAASLRAQKEQTGADNPGYHSRCVRYARLLEARGLPLRLSLDFVETYWRELFARIRPAPGAADLLRACRAHGLRVGLGTDMTAIEQFRKMEVLGLLDLVDFVVSSEEAGVEKPNPAFFGLVVRKAQCAPGEILFAGDNLRKDVRGSTAAGMRAVWVQPDAAARAEHPEVASVASLPELAALLP
jgi:putative hydrolase of the HAD superfamily